MGKLQSGDLEITTTEKRTGGSVRCSGADKMRGNHWGDLRGRGICRTNNK
ncbi:MAG: hypothetical protein P1V20_30300 [Verrucomicrobiales bacterium]|nr:hypothetical protein [Verrucomicrobiales bacterium]